LVWDIEAAERQPTGNAIGEYAENVHRGVTRSIEKKKDPMIVSGGDLKIRFLMGEWGSQ
jgi:hypothetical protein